MFESFAPTLLQPPPAPLPQLPQLPPAAAAGAVRPAVLARLPAASDAAGAVPGAVLAQMLDELDCGLLLVAGNAQVMFLNHAASCELDAGHPLQLLGRTLRAGRPQDVAPLAQALAAARRGSRRMVVLGEGRRRVSVTFAPLRECVAERAGDPVGVCAVSLGRRSMCEALQLETFARTMGLTPAETRVLGQLCEGTRPADIARRQGVRIATVRTQISSIRAKTGTASIREIERMLALLPPLVGTQRQRSSG